MINRTMKNWKEKVQVWHTVVVVARSVAQRRTMAGRQGTDNT